VHLPPTKGLVDALELIVPRVESRSVETNTATKDPSLISLFIETFDSYLIGSLSKNILPSVWIPRNF
jgi:hypothetical protein